MVLFKSLPAPVAVFPSAVLIKQRTSANRSVELASGQCRDRKPTNRHVEIACVKIQKGLLAFCSVGAGITAIRRWANRLRNLCKPKARQN